MLSGVRFNAIDLTLHALREPPARTVLQDCQVHPETPDNRAEMAHQEILVQEERKETRAKEDLLVTQEILVSQVQEERSEHLELMDVMENLALRVLLVRFKVQPRAVAICNQHIINV